MPVVPRIHVVGSSPRSGTTLMFELLVSCFDIDRFGSHEISLFEHPVPAPKRPYASKRPTDFIHVCRVLRWDAALHVIYMQRDPRDVVVSQHGGYSGRYWCDFDIWRRNQALLPRLVGHPRLFLCSYEEMVRDPDQVQSRLQERFSFLQPTHPFSRFEEVSQSSEVAHLALNGVRKVSTGGIGKWRTDLPRLAAQMRAFPDFPDHLIRAGYEADRSWLSALMGVTPNTSESIRSEFHALRGKNWLEKAVLRVLRRMSTLRQELHYIAAVAWR
jgi:hypothetical protein